MKSAPAKLGAARRIKPPPGGGKPDMPQRISRMPWVFLALIFSITTSAHAEEPRSQSASASCPMKKLASLQVHINEQGQTLVPVNIAGHDAWMALRLDQGLLALFGAAIAD